MVMPWRKLSVAPNMFFLSFLLSGAELRHQIVGLPSPAAGMAKENPGDGLKYVWIPPGTFDMGCSPGDSECKYDEEPLHRVRINKGFWLGQTDVTVGAYHRFAESTGRRMAAAPGINGGIDDHLPMVNVSWEDAQAYCGGTGGRLPTEAEWEYAARGGSTQARYGPIDEIAWYVKNSGEGIHEVAQKRPNSFGLYDLLGNVWEWVDDWYGGTYYHGSPAIDPKGPSSGADRVLRGGSWVSYPKDVRVSVRGKTKRESGNPGTGFRCVWETAVP